MPRHALPHRIGRSAQPAHTRRLAPIRRKISIRNQKNQRRRGQNQRINRQLAHRSTPRPLTPAGRRRHRLLRKPLHQNRLSPLLFFRQHLPRILIQKSLIRRRLHKQTSPFPAVKLRIHAEKINIFLTCPRILFQKSRQFRRLLLIRQPVKARKNQIIKVIRQPAHCTASSARVCLMHCKSIR